MQPEQNTLSSEIFDTDKWPKEITSSFIPEYFDETGFLFREKIQEEELLHSHDRQENFMSESGVNTIDPSINKKIKYHPFYGENETHLKSQLLKKFEGYVVSLSETFFKACFDDGEVGNETFFAEIEFEEIEPKDIPLIKEGTRLVWTIGYKDENGTRNRVSNIYVRRYPKIDDSGLEDNYDKASKIIDSIPWE